MTTHTLEQSPNILPEELEEAREIYTPRLALEVLGAPYGYWRSDPTGNSMPEQLRGYLQGSPHPTTTTTEAPRYPIFEDSTTPDPDEAKVREFFGNPKNLPARAATTTRSVLAEHTLEVPIVYPPSKERSRTRKTFDTAICLLGSCAVSGVVLGAMAYFLAKR